MISQNFNIIGNFKTFPINKIPTLKVNDIKYPLVSSSFYEIIPLTINYYNIVLEIFNDEIIPLCLCPSLYRGYTSTKYLFTWLSDLLEIKSFNNELGENLPYIVENGAAIYNLNFLNSSWVKVKGIP